MLIWAHLCFLIIKNDTVVPGKGLTQELDDITLTVEAAYSVHFTEEGKKILNKERNITTEVSAIYFLIQQKYINSRKTILKKPHIYCV